MFNPLNKWNSGPIEVRTGDPASFTGGVIHLTSTPNTLQTELGLAGAATVQYKCGNQDSQTLICCAGQHRQRIGTGRLPSRSRTVTPFSYENMSPRTPAKHANGVRNIIASGPQRKRLSIRRAQNDRISAPIPARIERRVEKPSHRINRHHLRTLSFDDGRCWKHEKQEKEHALEGNQDRRQPWHNLGSIQLHCFMDVSRGRLVVP